MRRLRVTVRRFVSRVRNQFVVGLILTVPLIITIWVFGWIFSAVDSILQPLINLLSGRNIEGIGLIAAIFIIYLVGVVSSNVVGQRLVRFGDKLITRVPFVRPLYTSVKEVIIRFSEPSKNNILQVALVEYPRKGVVSLAFITGEGGNRDGKKLLTLLIPTAPNPLSGFLVMMPEDEVTRTNIKPAVAMKMIISCGALLPPEVGEMLSSHDSASSPAPQIGSPNLK